MGLQSIANSEARDLAAYNHRAEQVLGELSGSAAIGDAVENFPTAIKMGEAKIREFFQKPGSSLEERAALTGANAKLIYGVQHALIHPTLLAAWKNSNLSDILIINTAGDVVYTVTKGPEFLKPVEAGPIAPLKPFVDEALKGDLDTVYNTGFITLPNRETASFLLRPLAVNVFGNTTLEGVVVVKVGVDRIASVLAPDGRDNPVANAFLLTSKGDLRAGTMTPSADDRAPAVLLEAASSRATGSDFGATVDGDFFYTYMPLKFGGDDYLLVVGQGKGKVLAAADNQALQTLLTDCQPRRRHWTCGTGQHPDQRDVATDPGGLDRLRERAGTADFNDVIDATTAGDLKHWLGPFGFAPIVDEMVSAQPTGALEFLVRRRGCDDSGAQRFGELQREDGNAASTLHQHSIAGFKCAIRDQCAPRGQSRGRQGSRFRMAPAPRSAGEGCRLRHHPFSGIPIHTISWDGREVSTCGVAVQPSWKEGRHDMIPNRELAQSRTNRLNNASAVGHGNAAINRWHMSDDHTEVVLIQRRGVNTHPNLARPRRAGIGQINEFESVETTWDV